MAASPSTSSDEQFAIGSVLDGRYRIEAVLGTGGMGCVYRAEHTKIGKSVAIKVLHADLGRNREASQRFQREAIASGRLDHPNIVGVSDFGVLEDGACYLVMEVLEGESLGDRLNRDKRIAWVEALDILRGVLYGLRHAHERGVVHRDIKPDNVYLAHKDGDPVIKILDFGIAKLYAGSADDPAQTRAGLTVGTPAYLSPEQAVGGAITPASDLYSASIVLYEMLAGRAPFEDKDPLAMLGAHVGRRPPPLSEAAPGVDVPAALEAILSRGLAKTVADRISTATEYLALLDAFSPPLHAMPRVTGQFATRAATAQPVPARSAVLVASVPASSATPVPGATAVRGASARVPDSQVREATDPRGSAPAPPEAPRASELAGMPRAARAVSLADVSEPIPLIVGALVMSIAGRCVAREASPVAPAPTAPAPTAPAPAAAPVDRAAQVRALVHGFEHGRTCGERRAALGKLVELREPLAAEVVKRARQRTATGDDGNACLTSDLDRAVKALGTAR